MIDIVADAKQWLLGDGVWQMDRTHTEYCHRHHVTCLVARLVREVEQSRLIAQTLSRTTSLIGLDPEKIK